jgi:UDP-glucose 4-epimerase
VRALITGCAGFIGSHLAESLLGEGHDVVGIDCFSDFYEKPEKLRNLAPAREWEAFEFLPLDLTRDPLDDAVAGCDVIFHLAGEPGVRSSWGQRFETYVRNNVLATQLLLETAAAHGRPQVVLASSSSVYGQAESFPTPEHAVPAPRSPYGMTKLAAEHLCGVYQRTLGLDITILRYFSVYGPRQRPDMAFNIFCRSLLSGRPVVLFGGEQTRDFTYVEDVVRATRAAGVRPQAVGGIYNIGGGSRVSLVEVVELLGELSDRPLVIERGDRQTGDVRDTAADISAAALDLGYAPTVRIDEGLQAEWAWALASSTAMASSGVAG